MISIHTGIIGIISATRTLVSLLLAVRVYVRVLGPEPGGLMMT